MSDFSEDMKRWADRSIRPRDDSPSGLRLRKLDAVKLLWRHPALWATAIYRASRWCHVHGLRGVPTLCMRLNMLLFGIEIGPGISIGPGLYVPHPYGMVLMADRIGANATFIHAVTVGMRNEWEFPVIQHGVFIGAGARILGGITLGSGCTVGANAVVLHDVPAGATAVGVPAVVRSADATPRPWLEEMSG
jgi:serine O-acetyltransferase